MKRAIIPIVILMACVIAVALKPTVLRDESVHVPVKSSSEPSPQKSNAVSYKGVRFNYDSSLGQTVTSETIPARVTGKPSDIIPEHPAFTLVGYPIHGGQPNGISEIRVFSVTKFREAVAAASREDAKQMNYAPNLPDWTIYFDEEVRVLNALIKTKPPQANIRSFLDEARGKPPRSGAMPFLPMWEAHQAFVGHVSYINFKNGKGVFFLTQWDLETAQVSNEGLQYAFQGITNDGRFYVSAEFSVAARFLPTGDEPEVIAWNNKNYLLSRRSENYQEYLRPILAKLNAMPGNEFRPDLGLLDQLIQSLEVQSK